MASLGLSLGAGTRAERAAARAAATARARTVAAAAARAECDRLDEAARPYWARLYAEVRAGRVLVGDPLRAAIVEALTYASERDPADRVRVHVVETGRCSAEAASSVLASLSHAEWCDVTAARAAWVAVERRAEPVRGPVVDLVATRGGRILSMRLDDRAAAAEGRAPSVPGRGPSRERTLHMLDAVCGHRAAGGTSGQWTAWCAARGISRASAARWWARAA